MTKHNLKELVAEAYMTIDAGKRCRKKVAWLYTLLLFWTGGTRFILEVTRRLKGFWDIYIIVEKASPEIKKECQRYGIELREIGFLTSTSPIYWLLFPWMLKLHEHRIKREVRDADVVVSGMFPMNVIATRLDKPTIQNCWEPFVYYKNIFQLNLRSKKLAQNCLFFVQLIIVLKSSLVLGLETGDVILLASGGHGFTMLESTEMIEVKQGPYMGEQDKTMFEKRD